MLLVSCACLPGIAAQCYFFGFGVLTNLLYCVTACLGFEALCCRLQSKNMYKTLSDNSALLTAVLLAISLPPYLPFWMCAFASLFSIVIAKHIYGGLGCNPFNPAMTGYAATLLSFPIAMTRWKTPVGLDGAYSIKDGVSQSLGFGELADAVTGATPLEIVRENQAILLEELNRQTPLFSEASFSAYGWEWVSLTFLAGGLWMLYRGIIRWHAPLSMLIAVVITSILFYDGGSSTSGGSPLFHLLNGATLFGAFFIVTDPVSGATSQRGRIVFAALVGFLVVVIRVKGYYPDAVAFAILLGNFSVPIIDRYSRPRAYGTQLKEQKP